MEQQSSKYGLGAFSIIWFGQLISLIGTTLTDFALGVWVYQETGSVTRFALVTVTTILPGVLISPVAGALIDRWDRKLAMIFSDTGAAICTLAIFILLFTNRIEIWHIYVLTALSSLFNAFQWPAYIASVTLLVPKKHLGRASGMAQFSEAIAQIAAPVSGGFLLIAIQIWGVILIDFSTFLFALLTLFFVRIPRPEPSKKESEEESSLMREIVYSWHYLTKRRGLLGLLTFYLVIEFTLGIVVTLVTPLILSFASSAVLGTILSFAGIGMLLGSVLMAIWGGPQRQVFGVLGFTLVQGVILLAGGLQPNAYLIGAAAFLFLFVNPIVVGCDQVIWQRKVAPNVQGRVLAIHHMASWVSLPFAALAAGPLADYIFEPLLAADGALAGSIGQIIGVGPGRGIGLLFIIMGILTILATIAGYSYPRLRLLEQELPDMISDDDEAINNER